MGSDSEGDAVVPDLSSTDPDETPLSIKEDQQESLYLMTLTSELQACMVSGHCDHEKLAQSMKEMVSHRLTKEVFFEG